MSMVFEFAHFMCFYWSLKPLMMFKSHTSVNALFISIAIEINYSI